MPRFRDFAAAKRLELMELKWHTDGCRTRQCSRHPFSLLVGVALTDTMDEVLSGNLCVWPGSHLHLRREPALRICDPDADPLSILEMGAPLSGYEGLHCQGGAAAAPGNPVALKLSAGDCVLLHPHMAHAVAPRYVASGIRVMVYFRLQLFPTKPPTWHVDETGKEVFFDLPGLHGIVGDIPWSQFLAKERNRAVAGILFCMPLLNLLHVFPKRLPQFCLHRFIFLLVTQLFAIHGQVTLFSLALRVGLDLDVLVASSS